MTLMNARATRGFTLVEVLVALFVLSIIAIASFRGLDAVVNARDAVTSETRKWQNLMFFFSRMEQDVALAVHRPVRDRAGVLEPEWIGNPNPVGPGDGQLILTRAGSSDMLNAQVGPQRIGYRLDNNTLYAMRWTALDQPPDAEPRRYAILQGVSDLQLRYMGSNGAWYEKWPMPGQPAIPVAVEVKITLAGMQPVTRVLLTQ